MCRGFARRTGIDLDLSCTRIGGGIDADAELAVCRIVQEAINNVEKRSGATRVLARIAEGRSNKEIGSALGISVRTVETHRVRIMDKLEIRSTAGLTKYAVRTGLADLP